MNEQQNDEQQAVFNALCARIGRLLGEQLSKLHDTLKQEIHNGIQEVMEQRAMKLGIDMDSLASKLKDIDAVASAFSQSADLLAQIKSDEWLSRFNAKINEDFKQKFLQDVEARQDNCLVAVSAVHEQYINKLDNLKNIAHEKYSP